MSTFAPLKPLISVPELDYEDVQLEPASLPFLMAIGKVQRVVAKMGTLDFNVFSSKFIGILDEYFNGCGGWRLTEFKDFDDGQHIIAIDAGLPHIMSESMIDILQAIGMLVHRAHNKIMQMDDRDWQMCRRPVEYVDTRELAEKYDLLEEASPMNISIRNRTALQHGIC